MQQFVPCNDCGNPIPIPEAREGEPVPKFLRCGTCGREVFWDIGLSNANGPLIVFSIEDSTTDEIAGNEIAGNSENPSVGIDAPALELEVVSDVNQESDSDLELEWSRDTEIEAGQFIADEAETGSPPDLSVLGPILPRRRSREVSAFRKIIPPILGGLAAIPIATLIMWYVVGRDIGSAGPTVAQYVPWIVPQKLRSTPWEYSRNSESFGSFGPQSSSPTPSAGLPKLNRQESSGEPSDPPFDHPAFAPNEDIPILVETSKPIAEDSVEKPSISETIAKLRELLKREWNKNTPLEDRASMVVEFNRTITRLSEQATELKGPASTIWRNELESIAREILIHPKVQKVIQLGPTGELPDIPSAAPGDFIATVIQIGDKNSPAQNAPWILKETWSTAISEVPIEVMPGAWRARLAKLPSKCLILGQLVANETSTGTVLKVHSILPQ